MALRPNHPSGSDAGSYRNRLKSKDLRHCGNAVGYTCCVHGRNAALVWPEPLLETAPKPISGEVAGTVAECY